MLLCLLNLFMLSIFASLLIPQWTHQLMYLLPGKYNSTQVWGNRSLCLFIVELSFTGRIQCTCLSYSSWLYSWDSIIPVHNWTYCTILETEFTYELIITAPMFAAIIFVVFLIIIFSSSLKYKQIYFKNTKWTQTSKQSTTCSNACTEDWQGVS